MPWCRASRSASSSASRSSRPWRATAACSSSTSPRPCSCPTRSKSLFETLRRLVGEGLSVVFISHKLGEVRAISDRVSVMRRGRMVGTAPGSTDERELARMMVGRPTFGVGQQETIWGGGEARLRVRGVSAPGAATACRPCTTSRWRSHAGEILGVAGVSGNGQTELAEVLSGMRAVTVGLHPRGRAGAGRRGAVRGHGRRRGPHPGGPPRQPRAGPAGLAEPHPRAHRRLHPGRPAGRPARRRSTRASSSSGTRSRPGRATAWPRCPAATSRRCSWRASCRATRGSSSSRSRRAAWTWAPASTCARSSSARRREGAAILLFSEDLDELLSLSDRIVVLYEGRVVGRMAAAEADPEQLGMLMAGRGQAAA